MKIAFDFRALDGPSKYRGIGIYVQNVSEHLLPLLKEHEVIIYVYDKKSLSELSPSILKQCEVIELKRPTLSSFAPLERVLSGVITPEKWATNHLPKVKDIDIFFQPYHFYGVPKKIKSVVVAYDLIPLLFEEEYFGKRALSFNPYSWASKLRGVLQKQSYRRSFSVFKKADRVLAISEQTKLDLMQFANANESTISVTLLGPPDSNVKPATRTFLKNVERPFVTYVGGIDGRRDLYNLVDKIQGSFDLLGVHLVLAGRDFEAIRDPELKRLVEKGVKTGTVHNLGFISEAQKRTLIEEALAVVYPTLYEGFGLPLLEAFEYGCPIITYNNSSIPEVGGEAALYADDSGDMIKHIHDLYGDAAYRKKVIAAGRERADTFSWKKTAQKTKAVLDTLI